MTAVVSHLLPLAPMAALLGTQNPSLAFLTLVFLMRQVALVAALMQFVQ